MAPASSETDAILVIDSALAFAVRRETFSAEEALQLLHGVVDTVHQTSRALIAQIATSAEHSYEETVLVDRSLVVDPLLDMRLALSD